MDGGSDDVFAIFKLEDTGGATVSNMVLLDYSASSSSAIFVKVDTGDKIDFSS